MGIVSQVSNVAHGCLFVKVSMINMNGTPGGMQYLKTKIEKRQEKIKVMHRRQSGAYKLHKLHVTMHGTPVWNAWTV